MFKQLLYFSFISAILQSPLTSAVPMETVVGSITYLSGGVGLDEAAEMKSIASQYALEVVSVIRVGSRDQYTADYFVSIRDKTGKVVLDTISEGPIFLANLPDGRYQVEVTYNGNKKQKKTVIRKGGHQRLVFVWSL